MKKPRHAKEIFDAFEKEFGRESMPAENFRYDEPLDDLMLTVLSQNTNDRNRDKAYTALRKKYPTWDRVARAPLESVIDCVKIAGLGEQKATHMQQILKILKEKFGEYSIKQLNEWETDDIRKFLVSLPGVGPKTAAIVLVFDLGREAFPVDTHITRISKRLGWALENWPATKIQEYLEATLDKSRFRGGHLNFLEHGRNVCDARKPKCEICGVRQYCEYYKSSGSARKPSVKSKAKNDGKEAKR